MANNQPIRVLSTILSSELAEFEGRKSPNPKITVLAIDGPLVRGFSAAPLLRSNGSIVAFVDGGIFGGSEIAWGIPINKLVWSSVTESETRTRLESLKGHPQRELF